MARGSGRAPYVSGNLAVDRRSYEYEYEYSRHPERQQRPYRSESRREEELRHAAYEQEQLRRQMAVKQQAAQRRHKNRIKLVIKTMLATLLVAGVCIGLITLQLAVVRNNRAIAAAERTLAEAQTMKNDLQYSLAREENLQQVEIMAEEMGMVYAAEGETHTVTLPEERVEAAEESAPQNLWQKLQQAVSGLLD